MVTLLDIDTPILFKCGDEHQLDPLYWAMVGDGIIAPPSNMKQKYEEFLASIGK